MITFTGLSLHYLQSYMERTRDGWVRLVSAGQVWAKDAAGLSGPALILPGIAAGVAVAALISVAVLRMRARREKRRFEQELAALLVRAQAAEAASAAKTEFLGTVSHEIRTPLNAILGFTQLALKTDLPPELHDYLDTVQSSAGCLMHTVDDVLEFSQFEAGALTLDNVPFSLSDCIMSALKMIEPEAQAKKLAIASKMDAALPPIVRGDPARLRRIVFSLLDNAVKLTARGSLIVKAAVEAAGADDVSIRVTVTDTGPGIPASEQPLLFEPFRANSNLKADPGALGLAVSSRLVQLMGGAMTLQSQLGAGSTFEFTARLEKGSEAEIRARMPACETTAREAAAHEPERIAGHERSILVVDDDAGSRRLVSKVLQSAGHRVWVAANGQEALHFSQTEAFDLIFMDLEMPGLDGLQVTREIRKNEAPGLHVPVYALTAHASAGHRESCLEAGMDGFLTKPVAVEELLKVLSELPSWSANPNGEDAGDRPGNSPEHDLEPEKNEFNLQAIWKDPEDHRPEIVDDAVITGTQELCNLAVETSREVVITEEPRPLAAVVRTVPDSEGTCGDSERGDPAASSCGAPRAGIVRSRPAADVSDPFVQARRALYKSRFDVRVIHNNGDPSDRNLI